MYILIDVYIYYYYYIYKGNNYQFNTCDFHKPVLVQRKSFNYGIVNSSIDPASPLYR